MEKCSPASKKLPALSSNSNITYKVLRKRAVDKPISHELLKIQRRRRDLIPSIWNRATQEYRVRRNREISTLSAEHRRRFHNVSYFFCAAPRALFFHVAAARSLYEFWGGNKIFRENETNIQIGRVSCSPLFIFLTRCFFCFEK